MKLYIDTNDWWIGYYRGPNHHYVCPVPTVVIRWSHNAFRSTVAGALFVVLQRLDPDEAERARSSIGQTGDQQ